MSLGFDLAGFDVVAAVELDPVHAAVHKFNFPTRSVLASSVIEVDGAEIRRVSGIGTGNGAWCSAAPPAKASR